MNHKPPGLPGNYIPMLRDEWAKKINAYKNAPDPELRSVARDMLSYHTMIGQASPWVITEAVRNFIMETEFPPNILEGWRLPYPTMAIEWKATYLPDLPDAQVECAERVILLADLNTASFSPLAVDGKTNEVTPLSPKQKFNGFNVINAFYVPNTPANKGRSSGWIIAPTMIVVPYAALNDTSQWLIREGNDIGFEPKYPPTSDALSTHDRPFPAPSMRVVSDAMLHRIAGPELLREGTKDMIEEIHMALGMLALLSCDNVPTREIKPSDFKQRRRKQMKKSPLPTYRTLHVSDHTFMPGKGGGGGVPGEKSPHWRRGHVKNVKTAKGHVRRWIKPTIVRKDKLLGDDLPKPETVLT